MKDNEPQSISKPMSFLKRRRTAGELFNNRAGNGEPHVTGKAPADTHPGGSPAFHREGSEALKAQVEQVQQDDTLLRSQFYRGAARLSRSEAISRGVVENAIDGIVLLVEGRIQYCNPQMLIMLGRTTEEVQGIALETYFAPGTRLELQEWNVRRSAGEVVPTRHENAIIHKDGHHIVVEIHASEMVFEDQSAVLAIVRDMTRRKQMELAEREALELAESLRGIGVALSASLDFDQVLDKTFEFIKRIVPYDSCCILLVEGNQVRPARYRGYEIYGKTAAERIRTLRINIETVPVIAQIYATRQPLIVRDTGTSRGWVDPLGLDQVQSWIGVPLVAHGQVIAIFSLDKCAPKFYATRHAERLALYAGQAALALENARLYGAVQDHRLDLEKTVAERTLELKKVLATLEQRVEERTQELAALYNVASTFTALTDLDQILKQTLEIVLATLGGQAGAILLLDGRGGIITLVLPIDLGMTVKGVIENLPACEPLWNRIIKEGKPVSVRSPENEGDPFPEFRVDPNCYTSGDYIGSPIHGTKEILGAFIIFGKEGQHFSPEDRALLSAITDQIGIAVENARLRQESERTAIAEERQRLARDLHDSVSQLLYSQVLYANASKKFIQAGNPDLAGEYINQLAISAQQALKEMRLMIYQLRPSMLEGEGLAGALKAHLETVEQRSGLQTSLTTQLKIKFPPQVEDDLYRMAQEALNNVLKHSTASAVDITLISEPGRISMEISDNGKGFDPKTVQEGIGLCSLRERASRLGGILKIESSPGKGTKVRVTIQEEA